MANFSGKINLLGFKNAQLMTGIDPDHPAMLHVCIPVPYNDISVSRDGKYANASIYMAETSDKFRHACIQRRQQAGDEMDGYMPPSHQVEVSFSREFRERALQSAKRRILSEHPEWQGTQQDEQYNQELRNQMYDAVRCRLGTFYSNQRRTDGYQQPASMYQQAAQPRGWQPQDNNDQQGFSYEPSDDLPF